MSDTGICLSIRFPFEGPDSRIKSRSDFDRKGDDPCRQQATTQVIDFQYRNLSNVVVGISLIPIVTAGAVGDGVRFSAQRT
jgi:hypothetical protein